MNEIQLANYKNRKADRPVFVADVSITRPVATTPVYAIGDVIGAGGASSVVTITNGVDCVVTWGGGTPAAHGLVTGDAVTFKTTPGAIGTGLADDTTYYVFIPVANPTTTFNLCATKAHALAGTPLIDTSGVTGATCTASKIGSAILTIPGFGTPGGMTIIRQAMFFNDAASLQTNLTGFRLHLYDKSPDSDLVDNYAWTLTAADAPAYLGYVDIGTPVDLGPSLMVQTAELAKYVMTQTGTLYGYLAIAASNTVAFAASSVSRVKLFGVGV